MNEIFPGVDEMIEKLRAAEDFDARVRLVYHYARDVMVDYSYSPSLAEYLAVTICTAEGNAELGLLDSMMGYSSRYIRDVFKQNYGITPKKYSNIMRFQNALRLLATGKYNNRLSSLATEAGYYDQPHLIRALKEYAAISPLEFLRLLEGQHGRQGDGRIPHRRKILTFFNRLNKIEYRRKAERNGLKVIL